MRCRHFRQVQQHNCHLSHLRRHHIGKADLQGQLPLRVLSTCVTKQVRDTRYKGEER
jgi:hypothetical protein